MFEPRFQYSDSLSWGETERETIQIQKTKRVRGVFSLPNDKEVKHVQSVYRKCLNQREPLGERGRKEAKTQPDVRSDWEGIKLSRRKNCPDQEQTEQTKCIQDDPRQKAVRVRSGW